MAFGLESHDRDEITSDPAAARLSQSRRSARWDSCAGDHSTWSTYSSWGRKALGTIALP